MHIMRVIGIFSSLELNIQRLFDSFFVDFLYLKESFSLNSLIKVSFEITIKRVLIYIIWIINLINKTYLVGTYLDGIREYYKSYSL